MGKKQARNLALTRIFHSIPDFCVLQEFSRGRSGLVWWFFKTRIAPLAKARFAHPNDVVFRPFLKTTLAARMGTPLIWKFG